MRNAIKGPPYKAGDKVRALYSGPNGTTLGTLTVTGVTALTDCVSWRIVCDRQWSEFPTVEYVVGITGKDRHGYCERAL